MVFVHTCETNGVFKALYKNRRNKMLDEHSERVFLNQLLAEKTWI